MNRQLTGYLVALLMPGMPPLASSMHFEGLAKSPETGATLYRESHEVQGQCIDGWFKPKEHSVDYLHDARPEPFASKNLSYTLSPLRPTVSFEQPDYGESITIRYEDADQLLIDWQPPDGKSRSYDLRVESSLVVDAGFDHFVRANWTRVVSKEPVEFEFLAPTRGDHYSFVLEPAPPGTLESEVAVRIRPTSLVLRFLVDPILLGYNQAGALIEYKGLTNIRRDTDSNHIAHIYYQVTKVPDCELTP